MHKRIISLMLLLCVLFLSSCSIGGSRTELLSGDKDDKQAKARLEQILEAIRNQDKDALKELFSENAVDAADDFDDSMNDLFDFFQGEVDSWEKSSGPTVFTSNSYGHITKKVSSYYYVYTDQQEYFFLLDDYPVDTDHPDNVGLYLLLVVKADDRLKIYDGDEKILYDGDKEIPRAGIYLPITDSDNEADKPVVETSEGEKTVQPS